MIEIVLLTMILALVGEIHYGVPYLIIAVAIYNFLGFVTIALMAYHRTCPFTAPDFKDKPFTAKLFHSFVIIVCWLPFIFLAIKEEYIDSK